VSGTLDRRAIGTTGLDVSVLGFGTMAVGGQYIDVDDAEAVATMIAARTAGISFFDTAPQYGCGLAEQRLGQALKNVAMSDAVVSSKVGKKIVPLGSGGQAQRALHFPGGNDAEIAFDFSYDGTRRIVDDSRARLGGRAIDMLLIHDVTRHFHGDDGIEAAFNAAFDGALRALHELRAEGLVRAIGIGLKDTDIAMRFIEDGEIDVALVPGRMSLLDQSAVTSGLLDTCLKHGTAMIAAAPFDSGILATGAVAGARSQYQIANADVLARVIDMERVCARHGVPLQAAALQYPLRHPAVACVLAGMKTEGEVQQNVAWMTTPIPDALWTALATECGVVDAAA
jgi:D-threo-aldose 1-dehydrogenase